MMAFVDTFPLQWLAHNDFCNLFYVAGSMLRDGIRGDFYLPPGSHNFAGTTFDRYAHDLFPGMLTEYTIIYNYPPISALIFLPFSYLPVRTAFVVWQVVTFLALAVAAYLFSRSRNAGWTPFLSIFTLFTVQHCFLLGQPTQLFAFLPLVAGYLAWRNSRNFTAGLIWSLLWLKAQILIPLGTLVGGLLLAQTRMKMLSSPEADLRKVVNLCAGLFVGSAIFFAITIAVNGWESIIAWLVHVEFYTHELFGKTADFRYIFMGSLPSVIDVLIPSQYTETYSRLIKIAIAIVLLLQVFLMYKVMKSNLDWPMKQDVSLMICILSLPIVSPYFRIYDLMLFTLVLWIYLYNLSDSILKVRIKQLLMVSWIGLDIYICVCTWASFASQLLFIVIAAISVMVLRVCIAAHKMAADASPSTSS